MNKVKAALAGLVGIGAYAFGLLIALPVLLWQAFVVHKLWIWYAQPAGLPAVAFASVVGFLLIWRAVTYRQEKIDGKPKEKEETWTVVANGLVTFLGPFSFLAIGWLLK